MRTPADPFEDILKNSYRNFHQKGFDYVCLSRRVEMTKKIYFFSDEVKLGDNLVNPHDHRYPFETIVLAGAISNSFYQEDPHGEPYNEFHWRTPLLGGKGHEWTKETRLLEVERRVMRAGARYAMDVGQLHTIRVHAPGTVILLLCGADVVAEDQPTRTFMHTREVPKLDGLYQRFDPGTLRARLKQYDDVAPR